MEGKNSVAPSRCLSLLLSLCLWILLLTLLFPFRGERMDRGAWIWAFWVPKLLVSDNIPADCCFVDKSCFTLTDPKDFSLPGSSVHGIFPGKHIGVGCHFLLQGIFLTQGSNTSLLQWLVDSLQLSHQGIVN